MHASDVWYRNEIANCHFCQESGEGQQEHYLSCKVLWRWVAGRLGMAVTPSMIEAHRFILLCLEGGGVLAIPCACMVDVALFCFDTRRHASVRSLADTRLKDFRRQRRLILDVALGDAHLHPYGA